MTRPLSSRKGVRLEGDDMEELARAFARVVPEKNWRHVERGCYDDE